VWLSPQFIWTYNQQQKRYKDYQNKKEMDPQNQYPKHKKQNSLTRILVKGI
jgi:hypothetical protein